jgi:hypothetical protein
VNLVEMYFWGAQQGSVSTITFLFVVRFCYHRTIPMMIFAAYYVLYHEKRIALVNNFVYLVPLKNIVQGRKGYSKVEKSFPWESSFPLF